MPRPKNILLRSAAVLAVGLGLLMTFAGGANAANPQPVSATELSEATTAAQSPTALRLLGRLATTSSAKTAGKLTVAPDTHAIYALNPAFVRDASAPVATFWYAATTATKGDQSLTVFTAPDAATGTWQPMNVASGNTEARMSTAARGALVFTEPQIGAWYALTGNRTAPSTQPPPSPSAPPPSPSPPTRTSSPPATPTNSPAPTTPTKAPPAATTPPPQPAPTPTTTSAPDPPPTPTTTSSSPSPAQPHSS
jgi:hypothetical protein